MNANTVHAEHHAVNPTERPAREPATYRHVQGDADETVVVIDHTTKTAAVWTTRRSIVARLIRLGATQEGRVGPGTWLQVPAAAIRFKNPRKKSVSEATRARLAALSKSRAPREEQPAAPEAARA